MMRPATLALVLIVVLSGLAAAACDDGGGAPEMLDGPVSQDSARGEVANRLCYEWRSCDCGEAAGVSLSGCETGIGFSWDATIERAQENGWTYDGDCLARRLNAMRERGCETADAVGFGCGPETCLIYHGDVAEGESCDGGVSASDCQQGLICLGTCQQPTCMSTAPLAEGEPCRDGNEILGFCEPPMLCGMESEVCEALPVAGEPCSSGVCAAEHWCDVSAGDGTCKALGAGGAPCTTSGECLSLQCDGETCAPLPGEGEVCTSRCAGDALTCMFDPETSMATCVRLPDEGEACLAETVAPRCREGLGCDGETCVAPPGEGEACLSVTSGTTQRCEEGLICGGRLCSQDPSAPGCDECPPDDDFCVAEVCMQQPAAVCSDNGGLLF